MRKKWIVCSVLAVSLCLGATALANGGLTIVVNGTLLDTGGKARIEKGTTLVPAKQLAEALGADVAWNGQSQTVTITKPDAFADDRRVELLELALAADSADKAVADYAEAVKTRNGAWQYALMTDSLKEKSKEGFESFNWVTGVSSPWVDRYTIGQPVKNTDGSLVYRVDYVLTDSTKSAYPSAEKLKLVSGADGWKVAEILDAE
ncbi:copper amine oxidase N-terminal domain-containing protein [Gorillibacterium massiliense]|uniref:copper amine oxidase N-terminal domain-containing protein n=1 Tax=Gorillibacterium massiliense TaxID=1280390 RepID=UPI0004B8F079|nr:copper amine oxidase N-terminal domain-containing protein [Gorillibacterium massiliense]